MTSQLNLPETRHAKADHAHLLAMREVRHAYGKHVALKNINLEMAPGEVVCLLGPSGCGKTTLLRIAAGLEVLQQGEVVINGRRIGVPGGRHVPPEKRNVGLAFQDSALFPHLTVLENVMFGLEAQPLHQRRQRALEWLEQLGMVGYAKVYPHMLSGGQQQRVALARALAPSPPLMLLDEPFSSLDARLRDQIRDDTLHVLKKVGAGTLLVTHDPEEAMFMADRIALMRDGRIVQMGTPQELYCNPSDPFVVIFFGSVNELHGEARGGVVQTPVGPVSAAGLADGTQAQVLIRPEALLITEIDEPSSSHQYSHVIMAKLLGRSSLLHICAHGKDGREAHLHARVPGVFLPAAGQPVEIRLDPSQVFVFPADLAGAGA
ncbi:ABC transporter [Litchfieldella anticariensis FP35 = DSM 16096]|uniref:ABC transporter n=1 Tax=Litchfieldella anticariensis (strain DSM 16096 / CECT 5854 / CIP 108499 / LMG 22089 / FP35) TaxID=1121939 RepID=S2KQK3_LITA3|nr:ABC transporter ATP-binding protein [Halomonas anticariensis]EPC02758.1 ABC transporter [Halomonas anticariensis FP35 = DSM 16096]